MTKNKLEDLNNHLFEQLERLNDDDLSSEDIGNEVRRADAIAKISEQIIKGATTAIKAQEMYGDKLLVSELGEKPALLETRHGKTA